MAPTLTDGDLILRPADGDFEALLAILTDPTVARWWGHYDMERVRKDYGDPEDESVRYIIEVGGEVAGLIQYSEETDPDYRHAGIDIALVEAFQGKGVGPRAIRRVIAHLIDDLGHHRVTIDPAAANRNAIRAYETVGFKPVGIMRNYERGADGAWHDGLLMDLLAEEFVR